jgi:hypothetical protein
MFFNINTIFQQYGTPQCVHSLNVPVLRFVFDLMMVQWTETCRRIFNIDYQYMLRYWLNKLLYYNINVCKSLFNFKFPQLQDWWQSGLYFTYIWDLNFLRYQLFNYEYKIMKRPATGTITELCTRYEYLNWDIRSSGILRNVDW